MSTLSMTSIFAPTSRPARTISLFGYVALWQQRRALAKMDARQLSDIGVSREEALAEAARPVWDLPENWAH